MDQLSSDLGPALRFPSDDAENVEYTLDDSDDTGSVLSSTSEPRNPRRQRRRRGRHHKLRAAVSMDGLSETSEIQPDSPVKEELCTFHVRDGHCKHGDNCCKLHRPSKLPYQWQVLRGSQWKHFDDQCNKSIEEAFCNPSIDNIEHVKVGRQSYTVEFDTMTMFQPKASHKYQDIRRLCTLPIIFNQMKNMQPYCTHWVWYWENTDQGTWEEYSKQNPPNQHSITDSDTLERAYRNYLRDGPKEYIFQQSSVNYINFENMTQNIGRQRNLKICRRPRFYTPASYQSFESERSTNSTTKPRNDKRPKTKTSISTSDKDQTQRPKVQSGTDNQRQSSDVKPKVTMPVPIQPVGKANPVVKPKVDIVKSSTAKHPGKHDPLAYIVPEESVAEVVVSKPKEPSVRSKRKCADPVVPLKTSHEETSVPPERETVKLIDVLNPVDSEQKDIQYNLQTEYMSKILIPEKIVNTSQYMPSDLPEPTEPKQGIKHNLQTNYESKVSKPEPEKPFASFLNSTSGSKVQEQGAAAGAASISSWSEAVEICTEYGPNRCPVLNCSKLHVKSAFQWQFKRGLNWQNFDDKMNTKLEETFSKPSADGIVVSIRGGNDTVYFNTLPVSSDCLLGNDVIRRLSTMSTVRCTEEGLKPFCVEWIWYWKDENGHWIEYAQKNSKNMQSDVNRNDLEKAYQNYLKYGANIYPFSTTGSRNNYHLNFQTMYQKNLAYTTQREVRRRPKFVTHDDRMKSLPTQSSSSPVNDTKPDKRTADIGSHNVPDTWDMKEMAQENEPKLIPLDIGYHEHEYMKVADMFWNTMDDVSATIVAIKRVQNLELWQDFSIKRERMTKKNKGQPVLEKQLWHGTKKESSEAICRQNFDFRISGSNVGTLYGQGSYFACKARYSDSYSTTENNLRRMFLVRVLVGSFVAGKREYKRPPNINPDDPLSDLYDSCVDREVDPSIYVVFDKAQTYPEYLIEYVRSTDQPTLIRQPAPPVPRSSSVGNIRLQNIPTTGSPSHWGTHGATGGTGYASAYASSATNKQPSSARYGTGSAPRPASSFSNVSGFGPLGNPSSPGMGTGASSSPSLRSDDTRYSYVPPPGNTRYSPRVSDVDTGQSRSSSPSSSESSKSGNVKKDKCILQ
ncbi:uncharacterized protein [Amphiura filiformis]|uniref:uncharacterized protein n=1 Tax=Amphiura filiformis TaxID=82378 RepID=UPI003B2108AA